MRNWVEKHFIEIVMGTIIVMLAALLWAALYDLQATQAKLTSHRAPVTAQATTANTPAITPTATKEEEPYDFDAWIAYQDRFKAVLPTGTPECVPTYQYTTDEVRSYLFLGEGKCYLNIDQRYAPSRMRRLKPQEAKVNDIAAHEVVHSISFVDDETYSVRQIGTGRGYLVTSQGGKRTQHNYDTTNYATSGVFQVCSWHLEYADEVRAPDCTTIGCTRTVWILTNFQDLGCRRRSGEVEFTKEVEVK